MRLCGVVGDVAVLPCTAATSAAAGCLRSPWDSRFLPFPSTAAPPDSLGRTACSFGKLHPFVGWSAVHSNNHRMRNYKVKAFEASGMNQSVNVPLDLESPAGQLLSQIMQTHPHLLPAAIDQQLETLQADRDAQKDDKPPGSSDLLYKRIAEVKEKDRRKGVEEIMYCLVVQKFMDNGIVMIPRISPSTDTSVVVDSWPNQERKLESVHSPDELELVQSHVSLVLGERSVGPLSSVAQMSKMKLGKLYAASIMYGYFLERVDQRFQLEKRMNTLPPRVNIDNQMVFGQMQQPNPLWDMESMVQIYREEEEGSGGEEEEEGKQQEPYRLRSYVMYVDVDTLQRYATIRSKEAISLIEKQTQALFGRPDITVTDDGTLDVSNDEVVSMTQSGLTMLILEAVAFGSFLWDAESYVESKYQFISNS